MASSVMMGAVEVSPEMLTLFGNGALTKHIWPDDPVAFHFEEQSGRDPLQFTFHAMPARRDFNPGPSNRLILIVARAACERLLEGPLEMADGARYLIPAELRSIAVAIRDCEMSAGAAVPYRLAKSIEMLCEILRAWTEGEVLHASPSALSFGDCRRITAARQLIDDNWDKPLSLSDIARHCGVNRSKLSRGFRALYGCSIAEAVAERRLGEARRQLIATDLPVGQIGYRTGYLNNASFSRAFCRRFGVPPSDFRLRGMAA